MKYSNLVSGVLGFLLLVAVWGCGPFSSTGQNSSSSNQGAPAAPSTPMPAGAAPSGRDPRGDLIAALRNRNNAPSYRMEGSISQLNGANYTITTEFQSPDRFHVIRRGQVGGLDSQNGETIGIGSDTWHKSGDGPWKKSPVSINLAGTIFGGDNVDELAKDNTAEIKYLGTESLDGSEMKVYQYSGAKKDEDTGETTQMTGKYWVGVSDNRPHKMEGQSDAHEDGRTVASKVSVTFDYTAVIKIEPPM